MLLSKHRSQSVLSAGNEQKQDRREKDAGEQRTVGNGSEGKAAVYGGRHAAKQQHETSIPHAERTPGVADESENKGQIERYCGQQPEMRELVRLEVQLVFEEKRDRDVDQASEWRAKSQQDDQHAQVQKNPVPYRRRQGVGSVRNHSCYDRGTVGRHAEVRNQPIE